MRTHPSHFWWILLLAACMTGAGSSEPPAPEEPTPMPMSLGEPVELHVGDVARLDDPEPMTIRFLDVPTDSRCPKGVTCVWEGDAEAVFEVRLGDEAMEVGLHTHGGRATFAGYVPAPYPVEGRPIELGAYVATVEMTEGSVDGAPDA